MKHINDIREELRKTFVSLERYMITEKLVFGVVGLILVAVVAAILKGILK